MTGKPNVLFIFADQQHWQALGFEDPSFRTPNLNRLASEGIVFKNSFCTTPQCSPSRSSIMTGFYPSKTGVMGNHGAAGGSPLRMRTIGAILQEAGYHTAYFGKWHLGKDPVGIAGWDEDFGVTGPETTDDQEVTRRALDFLGRLGSQDKPFALFLSYNNPHQIYEFDTETDPAPREPGGLPPTWYSKDLATVLPVQQQFMRKDQGKLIVDAESPAWERYRELYREKVQRYDNEVGRVLTAFNEHGLMDDTLVVATSDHGDMDGQHRLIFKGPFMYEHMVRVPLIIRSPASDRKPPKTVDWHTVNVDLVPTLADFAGVAIPETDGISLAPLISGNHNMAERPFVVGQYYSKQRWISPIRMIRTKQFKYNYYRGHGEELYDMIQDPTELVNLADNSGYRDAKKELRSMLNQWISENNDPFDSQEPTTQDGQAL